MWQKTALSHYLSLARITLKNVCWSDPEIKRILFLFPFFACSLPSIWAIFFLLLRKLFSHLSYNIYTAIIQPRGKDTSRFFYVFLFYFFPRQSLKKSYSSRIANWRFWYLSLTYLLHRGVIKFFSSSN